METSASFEARSAPSPYPVIEIAIGRHFDIDADSEPDTDSDPEIPSERSIFEAERVVAV
jgi:hypothetical protein